MKKIIIILNILLMCIMLSADVFYSINQEYIWCKHIGSFCVLAIVFVCLLYAFKVKKINKFYFVSIISAIVFSLIADLVILYNITLGFILFVIAIGLFYIAFLNVSKFIKIDLLCGGSIAIPIVSIIVFGQIFGFKNVFIEILIILYAIAFSLLIGKSVINIIKSRKAIETLNFVATILFFISNFVILCHSFSYVSHFILIVYIGLLHISLCLFAYSMYTITKTGPEKAFEEISFLEQLKLYLKPVITAFILMLFIGYSTVISFRDFNIANPKISVSQFYQMVGNNLKIPVIEINTQYNLMPVSKEEYVNASFKISNCENSQDNFEVKMKDNYGDEDSVGIRLRGNSTKLARKRPFRIKFDKKKSLMGLEKNKSWVLLADYYDQSYLRNYVAFSIASDMDNMKFTPTPNHVALIINGNFQGLYLLCEQIDEKEGRTGVEEDFNVEYDTEFPFLVEMDALAHKEGIIGVDNFYVEGFKPVEIKYPEADERGVINGNDKVYKYINEYINAVFTTLRTGSPVKVSFRENLVSFEDLVDIDSAVDYYLMYEIMCSSDQNNLKSIYMNKSKDGKMQFGPIWDFDWSMTGGWEVPYVESGIETANILNIIKSPIFNKLLKNEAFYTKVVTRFNEIKSRILEVAENLKTYKAKIDNVASIDTRCWHGVTGQFQYDMQYDYVRLYLQDRYTFLDGIYKLSHADFVSKI